MNKLEEKFELSLPPVWKGVKQLPADSFVFRLRIRAEAILVNSFVFVAGVCGDR